MYHFLKEYIHTCNHSPPVGINEGKKNFDETSHSNVINKKIQFFELI